MSAEWPIRELELTRFGDRVAAVAVDALADGKLGQASRTDFYRAFIACGGTEDLSRVKTSCAVFAGACLHWAGRPARLPRYPASGATSISSWLAGPLAGWHAYGHEECRPERGAVFYVEADSNPNNNHVGVLVDELAPGVWLTAEGGGGDGTECKFTWRRWGLGWDSRRIRGLWLPAEMDRVGLPPPKPGALPPPEFPIIYADVRRDVVKRWQQRLLAWDPKCLPKYGADGGYGNECAAATLRFQGAKGLPLDGNHVTLETWDAAG